MAFFNSYVKLPEGSIDIHTATIEYTEKLAPAGVAVLQFIVTMVPNHDGHLTPQEGLRPRQFFITVTTKNPSLCG